MKIGHKTIIFFSGLMWMGVGIFLMTLGLKFLNESLVKESSSFSLLNMIGGARANGVVILIAIGLMIGYFKGKFVLAKAADRELKRIFALPNPTTFKNFYSKRYYILLCIMIALGMTMRHLPISLDTRGFIDVAIGAALINGSRFYFKNLLTKKNHA